ncbi:hypothetical protein Tco_0151940 [Tanacetum coccineum]
MFLLDYNRFPKHCILTKGSHERFIQTQKTPRHLTPPCPIPFEDRSDIGSPRVDGPPIMPEDPYAYIKAAYQVPPSPDYIHSPEEPQSPPPLDFVPEPMYPEYIPQGEEQPLPAATSPTADSPGYVPESNPKEESEEDDEDPEEDPA